MVAQEFAAGTEYAIGTISCDGQHYLSHLIQYTKTVFAGRSAIYDHVALIAFDPRHHQSLIDYTWQVLDALGIRWGATHTEIMLTPQGPRLIETGVRMCGGPMVHFSREASGSSQADKLVEIYLDGRLKQPIYSIRKTVMPVFIRAHRGGVIQNPDIFKAVATLPSLFQQHLWFHQYTAVAKTEDYLSILGIIALSGHRSAVLRDLEYIRVLEKQLVIV